ncbi:type II toxin-antitoxin system Phd/YefM family antitoxin [Xenorhabdus doucetiae]|uniref:type II toxin-antitoxin system Phd/YefM family antitoxin n=1 Tax=Xenorhabdus doucetiae TaxID=351671 RepID=UPI002B4185D1|nr:type II toxin-antitoxin system prevent-host-death family antitoxin [Xenorhabdus sp. 18]
MTRPTRTSAIKIYTKKVSIYDAKTNLSRIVQEVARTGEPVVIAKNGHALVKIVAYREEKPKRKLGFLKGKGSVPLHFDDMNSAEIADMFEGKYS